MTDLRPSRLTHLLNRRRALALSLMVLLALLVAAAPLPFMVYAQQTPPPPTGTLAGFALIPPDTFADGPASGRRLESSTQLNGRTVPFSGQPVQSFSAIVPAGNGNWLVVTDNGYGSRFNSDDFYVRIYELKIDFQGNNVEIVRFINLSDPDRYLPFPIVNQDGGGRLLTGRDIDPESFRIAPDGTYWIGDEFGPYLLHFNAEGALLEQPFVVPVPEALKPWAKNLPVIISPEHPDVFGLPDNAARLAASNGRLSRGIEGLVMTRDGSKLYALFEGGLQLDPMGQRTMIYEFDLTTKAFTGKVFYYPMTLPGYVVSDMAEINDNEFLVLERDGAQGADARYKRLFRIDLRSAAPDGVISKSPFMDLLLLTDPNGLTKETEGVLGYGRDFKYVYGRPEIVYVVDAQTVMVVNDNDYPFFTARKQGEPDGTEFILVTPNEPLNVGK